MPFTVTVTWSINASQRENNVIYTTFLINWYNMNLLAVNASKNYIFPRNPQNRVPLDPTLKIRSCLIRTLRKVSVFHSVKRWVGLGHVTGQKLHTTTLQLWYLCYCHTAYTRRRVWKLQWKGQKSSVRQHSRLLSLYTAVFMHFIHAGFCFWEYGLLTEGARSPLALAPFSLFCLFFYATKRPPPTQLDGLGQRCKPSNRVGRSPGHRRI